jgi:hypothetical protein
MEQVLFEQGGIKLIAYPHLTDQFRKQMTHTILGRKGSLRYQHTLAVSKASRIDRTVFLQLQWRSRLIGSIALSLQQVKMHNLTKNVIYVRYFSISGLLSNHQGQDTAGQGEKKSKIKAAVIELFKSPSKLFPEIEQVDGMYAYVEADNLPSRRNVEMTGFQQIGHFTTLIYSRMFPRKRLKVEILEPQQFPQIKLLLDAYYQDHHLVPNWYSIISHPGRKYIVHKVDDEIVVGACFSLNQWNIISMPGAIGWINRNLLSKIPLVRRVFFGDRLQFLDLEMVYIKKGFEAYFPLLIETLLFKENLHHALLWSAPTSTLHNQLIKGGNFGILQKLNQPSKAGVYFKSFLKEELHNAPCYISADGIS